MNKKIKIIDIANKLRNPIDMPKRVKYKDTIYIYDEQRNNYFYCDHEIYISECLKDILNEEVEILEDNTEEIEELPIYDTDEKLYSPVILDNRIKINELVKAVNKLRKEKE